MNSDTNQTLDVEPVLHASEPVQATYEDSLEGLLQYHADRSLWFKEQSRTAKTAFKRDYYQKKLVKNNKNLWKLLVRTPNAYNPLMEYLAPQSPGKTTTEPVGQLEEGVNHVGYMQIAGEETPAPGVLTTTETVTGHSGGKGG